MNAMAYVVTILDDPQREHLQAQFEQAHYDYLRAHEPLIMLRGGLGNETGSGSIGGLLVLDLPSREAVHAFIARDPFAQAGLQAEVTIRPFVPAHGAARGRWGLGG